MKIGILTQPLGQNYGGLLQNYALQIVLRRMGHNVETIDQIDNSPSYIRKCITNVKTFIMHFLGMGLNRNYVSYSPNKYELSVIRKNTNLFINKYIKRTPIMRRHKDFCAQAKNGSYDAFIVGSDQCWRPRYNRFIEDMFLSFAYNNTDILRIAYAASFGTEEWEYSNELTSICLPLIKKFNYITVRENSGVSLCQEHFKVTAYHVLDPTMLLDKEDYIKLVEAEDETSSDGELFTYILDPNQDKENLIRDFSVRLGMKNFKVLPKYLVENWNKKNIKSEINNCVYPKVTTWLKGFMDSKMTIVDSFHGMVFSIIFNKPFWVLGNKTRGNSRFESLLSLLQLQDRMIDSYDIDSIDILKPIDWTSVNSIIKSKKTESLNHIINALDLYK